MGGEEPPRTNRAKAIRWRTASSIPRKTTEEITAHGRQITVKLNGTTIVDANLDEVKDEEMLKAHRDLSKPEGSRGIANTKGHIGFLGHGARVEFRNIRIKEL